MTKIIGKVSATEKNKTILAMPRDLIMFRKFYEDSGDTAAWQELYSQLSEAEIISLYSYLVLPSTVISSILKNTVKDNIVHIVSRTTTVSTARRTFLSFLI